MASLGTLAVNIVARTEKFTGGVTKTMSSLDKLSGHITGVRSALGALTGAFAAYASASYFKGVIDEFGELSDMAMSINTTREALQGLHHAAILSGVSTGKLDNSLQKLVVNVSKANATGKGSVFDAINELGLKTSELARLSPDEQLKKIADAMGGVANHSDKARLAYTIFGKAGVSLLPMLSLYDQTGEAPWQLAVPALAQITLMGRVLKAEAIAPWELLLPLAVCALLCSTCLAYVARRLRGAALA